MQIFSIGFEKRSSDELIQALQSNKISRFVDVRCFPDVESAGYAKRDNLLRLLKPNDIEYLHYPLLAPTPELLKDYFEKGLSWADYEKRYMTILSERQVENKIPKGFFDNPCCFFCLEHEPQKCHRRLALEYLQEHWDNTMTIKHLV